MLAISYVARPYNFYVFHRQVEDVDVRYLIQSSSLEYIANHKFDFNKWIYEGISFLSPADEARVRRRLDKDTKRTMITLNPSDKTYIEAILYVTLPM